jgi:pilus assembly protein Flp/PilA
MNSKYLKSFKKDEKGASMLEYALLAALIAVVAITMITLVGRQACQSFSRVSSSLAAG